MDHNSKTADRLKYTVAILMFEANGTYHTDNFHETDSLCEAAAVRDHWRESWTVRDLRGGCLVTITDQATGDIVDDELVHDTIKGVTYQRFYRAHREALWASELSSNEIRTLS